MITVDLPQELFDQLDAQCAEFELSRDQAIEQAVKMWLAQCDGRRWIARRDARPQVA